MWKTIRSQFVREFNKKTKPKTGSPGEIYYSGTWSLFNSLLFLKDSIEPRKMSGNTDILLVDSTVNGSRTVLSVENTSGSSSSFRDAEDPLPSAQDDTESMTELDVGEQDVETGLDISMTDSQNKEGKL